MDNEKAMFSIRPTVDLFQVDGDLRLLLGVIPPPLLYGGRFAHLPRLIGAGEDPRPAWLPIANDQILFTTLNSLLPDLCDLISALRP